MKPPYKICRMVYGASWDSMYEMQNSRLMGLAIQFLSSMRYIRAKK